MRQWRYFDPETTDPKLKGCDPFLITRLDYARHSAGVPFVIVSGYRSEEENKNAGGVKNSAHMKGLAADIRCNGNKQMNLILKGIYQAGFQRIGLNYYKVEDKWEIRGIHVDIDTAKEQDTTWTKFYNKG